MKDTRWKKNKWVATCIFAAIAVFVFAIVYTITRLSEAIVSTFTNISEENQILATELVPWDVSDIAAFLGAPFPQSLIEVMNNSNRARDDYFISLVLEGPQAPIVEFAEAICAERLKANYDPFRANNTVEPISGAYLIKMRNYTYYSYSTIDTETNNYLAGDRCYNARLGISQVIAYNSSNQSTVYNLRIETQGSGAFGCTDVPCRDIGVNYVNPIGTISPLILIGVHESQRGYFTTSNEICLEMQLGYDYYEVPWVDEPVWAHLHNATIELFIDDILALDAYIHDYGRIAPTGVNEIFGYYNTCFVNNLPIGRHAFEIVITTPLGITKRNNFEVIFN